MMDWNGNINCKTSNNLISRSHPYHKNPPDSWTVGINGHTFLSFHKATQKWPLHQQSCQRFPWQTLKFYWTWRWALLSLSTLIAQSSHNILHSHHITCNILNITHNTGHITHHRSHNTNYTWKSNLDVKRYDTVMTYYTLNIKHYILHINYQTLHSLYVTGMLQGCYRSVTVELQGCCRCVIRVLQGFSMVMQIWIFLDIKFS